MTAQHPTVHHNSPHPHHHHKGLFSPICQQWGETLGWGEALSLVCLESSQVILMRDCGLIKCSAISLGILESFR